MKKMYKSHLLTQ